MVGTLSCPAPRERASQAGIRSYGYRIMRVLGIETSCDETGVAIYDSEAGLLAHALYSQVKVHAEYGGVVPELASRDHVRKLLPMIRQLLAEAGCEARDIDGVAYTAGPGLIGALMVGGAVGRSLAYAWGVPAIGVHHMEGHLLAPMLEPRPPAFPFVTLKRSRNFCSYSFCSCFNTV